MKQRFAWTGGPSLRFIVFCCVGAANTLADFLIYSCGIWIGIPPYAARVISYMAGCLFSFFGNKRWTFKVTDKGAAPLLRFMAVNISTLCLGVFLLFIFKKMGCGNTTAYLLSLPFTLASNYFGYRLWAFREIHES